MRGDGRALPAGPSHFMGTNFAAAFGITYTGESGGAELCHTTSWGVRSRMRAGLSVNPGGGKGVGGTNEGGRASSAGGPLPLHGDELRGGLRDHLYRRERRGRAVPHHLLGSAEPDEGGTECEPRGRKRRGGYQ